MSALSVSEEEYNIDPKLKGDSQKSVGQMNTTECLKVVNILKEKAKFESDRDTIVCISGLCQLGNRNAGKGITYTFKDKKITSGDLWTACQSAKPQGTPRQFARSNATIIARFAIALQEPGDLSRQMKLDHPDISLEEQCWCSNFQSANPDCPSSVRNWLRNDFRNRFNE